MRFLKAALMLTVVVFASTQVFGHYLWVTIDKKSGEHGTTNIYFEGSASPGDGQYLDPFVNDGTTWFRTLKSDGAVKLAVKDTKAAKKRWLQAALPSGGARSVESYAKWGVYRYGKTDVLLHYYAKNIDANNSNDRIALGRAKQQALDIVPVESDAGNSFQILWKGKPVANTAVKVRGAGLKGAKTDKDGRFKVAPTSSGQVTFHVTIDEKESGTDKGKDYSIKRHHATLILKLTVRKIVGKPAR
jgi:uncharacterized GH25 family protein